jgi:hypothetical protein
MMKMTPTPDVVDSDDEHYTAPLQAPLPRRDDDKDNPRQVH